MNLDKLYTVAGFNLSVPRRGPLCDLFHMSVLFGDDDHSESFAFTTSVCQTVRPSTDWTNCIWLSAASVGNDGGLIQNIQGVSPFKQGDLRGP